MYIPNPIYNNLSIRDFNRTELYEACHTLDLEYRGTGTTVDSTNIANVAKGISQKRLEAFALYINIIQSIIDRENKTYINPPTRNYTTKSGNKLNKKLQAYIDALLDQMRFDSFMQKYERYASLLGTVLVRPTTDERDGRMSLLELTPSNASLKVTPDSIISSKAAVIEYETEDEANDTKYQHKWDYENYAVTTTNKNGQDYTVTEPHGFKEHINTAGGCVYAILNFLPDNNRFWGAFDGTLYSFVKQRSLVLANTCARLHLAESEKMILKGMSPTEAVKYVKEKIIFLPNDKTDVHGQRIEQGAEILQSSGDDAMNLLQTYLSLYYHLMDVRGHAPKNFTRGADAQSAEAVRLGGVDMRDKHASKKAILKIFEQDLWKRIIWENNRQPNTVNIPEDTTLVVDWKPDPMNFNSASDEVTHFTTGINHNVHTPIDWIRSVNPELSLEEAEAKFEQNRIFNQENTIEMKVIENNESNINQEGNEND